MPNVFSVVPLFCLIFFWLSHEKEKALLHLIFNGIELNYCHKYLMSYLKVIV